MAKTLDRFLTEVDRWKQPVSDRTRKLTAAKRGQIDAEGRSWLESKLGRRLKLASKTPATKARRIA